MAGMTKKYQFAGWQFKATKKQTSNMRKLGSFARPMDIDGSYTIEASGGFFGQAIDLDAVFQSEVELIQKYREISSIPEVDMAIEDIVTASIVTGDQEQIIELDLGKTEVDEATKEKMQESFDEILELLDFNTECYDLFRRWYIDGKIYFHKIVDTNKPKNGIQELRQIDPTRMQKIREIVEETDESGNTIIKDYQEYYTYLDDSSWGGYGYGGNKVSVFPDAIAYAPSGLYDPQKNMVLGYLYKAIRPANQLRMLEHAVVIYRLARAPERRAFYIDTGSLPKNRAEQYVRKLMTQYRNKIVYDANTGELRDNNRHLAMTEDYWLPRREGSQGTQIETLQGGQNLGEIEDVRYFQKKLYQSLYIPITRLEPETGFSLGRASEMTRDELKFSKFVDRLRTRFAAIFYDLLKTQVILKGIMTLDEWQEISNDIFFDFRRDSHFTELKEAELMTERMNLLQSLDPYVGKYFSHRQIRLDILRQTEEEIDEIDKQIEKEKDNSQYADADNDGFGGGGFGGGGFGDEPGGGSDQSDDDEGGFGYDEPPTPSSREPGLPPEQQLPDDEDKKDSQRGDQ